MMNNLSKRGQVTIFIIIAIIIVAAVVLYFVFRGSLDQTQMPVALEPVYSNFLNCLEEDILTGISLLETQGGYIELPEFDAGSRNMPFSSQLNFLGNPIPYWYYVSGNNFEKEQVPSIGNMEADLEKFVEQRVRNCEFNSYYDQGFKIELGDSNANVNIKEESVVLDLNLEMGIEKGNESVFVRNHEIEVDSRLGKLYDSAIEVYERQQEDLFLEEYGVDVLRSYSPVDGVEISCSPLVWSAENVVSDLRESIEVNTIALNSLDEEYYDLELPVEQRVRFLNSQSWPGVVEISPNEGDFLMSNPVGNQPGLGIIGFCYVPYHFTYNVRYPVLIQVYDEQNQDEIFQFPVAVLIEGNQPRESTNAQASRGPELQLCEFKNTPVRVSVLDSGSNSVEAQISYECLSQKCNIGRTENGVLNAEFPQCANGYVIANADGFEEGKYLLSTVSPGSIEVVLDEFYDKGITLNVEGRELDGNAIITFSSDKKVETLVYPDQRVAELSEGNYEITVQVYEEADVNLGSRTAEQCIDVSRGGILGVFGFTQERCFDINVPEQTISQVLVAGGSSEFYLSESNLASGRNMELNVPSFDTPETIEDVQENYVLFDNSRVGVEFK